MLLIFVLGHYKCIVNLSRYWTEMEKDNTTLLKKIPLEKKIIGMIFL
jgi:hypothetical protein